MAESDDRPQRAASRRFHAAIDRLEDELAVLLIGDEEQTQVDFPVAFLPEGVADGDHLQITISIDRASRDSAADRVKSLQEKLTQAGGAQDQKDFKL